MPHRHDHTEFPEASWGRRLIATMIMNLIIPAVQIAGGVISGSMALVSDALHNLMDFVSVVISYAALRLGRRGPSLEQTFGYRRLEVLGAVLNVALLFGAGFYILVESWSRLKDPKPIEGAIVIGAALIGFAANLVATLLLRSGARVNLNMRGAFLHMLTDALTSLGVALLGVIWLYRPWYWLDPVVSTLIVAMILYSGWNILKEALGILMNKDSFDALSPEEQQALMTAGEGLADEFGRILGAANEESVQILKDENKEINTISDADREKLIAAGEPYVQEWITRADAAGLDGQAMVDEYKALVVEYTRERDEKGYPWAPKG